MTVYDSRYDTELDMDVKCVCCGERYSIKALDLLDQDEIYEIDNDFLNEVSYEELEFLYTLRFYEGSFEDDPDPHRICREFGDRTVTGFFDGSFSTGYNDLTGDTDALDLCVSCYQNNLTITPADPYESNYTYLYILDFDSVFKIGITQKSRFKRRLYELEKEYKEIGLQLNTQESFVIESSQRHGLFFAESKIKSTFQHAFVGKKVTGYSELFNKKDKDRIVRLLKYLAFRMDFVNSEYAIFRESIDDVYTDTDFIIPDHWYRYNPTQPYHAFKNLKDVL